jgi:hypothetical protein
MATAKSGIPKKLRFHTWGWGRSVRMFMNVRPPMSVRVYSRNATVRGCTIISWYYVIYRIEDALVEPESAGDARK